MKWLEHDPVPVGYALTRRANTRVPYLETRVTFEMEDRRGHTILGGFGRQGQILYRDPVQRCTDGCNVINVLTGSDIRAVSNGQELLKRLPGTRLELIIRARIVVPQVDDWEEDHFFRRNDATARGVETTGASQKPDRSGSRLIDGAIEARRIEEWIDREGYSPHPLRTVWRSTAGRIAAGGSDSGGR